MVLYANDQMEVSYVHSGTPKSSKIAANRFRIETYGDLGIPDFKKPPIWFNQPHQPVADPNNHYIGLGFPKQCNKL